jgi:hypothetical protein
MVYGEDADAWGLHRFGQSCEAFSPTPFSLSHTHKHGLDSVSHRRALGTEAVAQEQATSRAATTLPATDHLLVTVPSTFLAVAAGVTTSYGRTIVHPAALTW